MSQPAPGTTLVVDPSVLLVAEAKAHRGQQKHPKLPTFPVDAQATAQKLREIIDAGGPQKPLAYAALSRLCVLWTPDTVPVDPTVMVNELIDLMAQLFPNGEGLIERDGL